MRAAGVIQVRPGRRHASTGSGAASPVEPGKAKFRSGSVSNWKNPRRCPKSGIDVVLDPIYNKGAQLHPKRATLPAVAAPGCEFEAAGSPQPPVSIIELGKWDKGGTHELFRAFKRG